MCNFDDDLVVKVYAHVNVGGEVNACTTLNAVKHDVIIAIMI